MQTFVKLGCCAVVVAAGCTEGAASVPSGVTAGSGGSSAGATTYAGASSGGNAPTAGSGGVAFGGTPGLDPSTCAGLPPEPGFALSSGALLAVPGPYVVLTGTLPSDQLTGVSVRDSARGVRVDSERKTWSYFLASAGGDYSVTAGAAPALSAQVTVGGDALPARDITDARSVGAWMFTWFTGDTSWECGSPWRPIGGFAGWDGSVAWARDQLLDQLDAHLDVVGLQLDTPSNQGTQGYRFQNIVNVLEAARDLLEEGVLPPRLFPFLDTAIIANHYQESQGSMLDVSSDAGRAYFYDHAKAFYVAAQSTFGDDKLAAGVARFDEGRPAVATWHSEAFTGADDGMVLDFKARFAADFTSECYFIAHPNDWRNFAAVDEITQMVGPPTHFMIGGRDPSGASTINLTAGFWNPLSNTFYLPREGGTHFDQAWQMAQAERDAARHVWIDTWNETGEGSGMFAADTLSYTPADTGPCADFVNLHAESWGDASRHYIDVTRTQASTWNDSPDLDAMPVASDLPSSMHPGEQRYVTIVMRNSGDVTWTAGQHMLGLTSSSAASDFHIDGLAAFQNDELVTRFNGVARGMPAVFTVLLTAPCAPGAYQVAFEIYDAQAGGFGSQLQHDIEVAP